MKLAAPIKFVQLSGNMTVAGMSRNNLEPLRDECALHLHQETGGVVMQHHDEVVYIPAHAIANVEFQRVASTPASKLETPQETPRIKDVDTERLEEELLAEFEDTRGATKARGSRRKK